MQESDQLQAIYMDSGVFQLHSAALKLINFVRRLNLAAGRAVCAYTLDDKAIVTILTTDLNGFLASLNLDSLTLTNKLAAA